MAMTVTFKEGKPKHLCTTCRSGQVTTYEDGQKFTLCNNMDRSVQVQGTVIDCTAYQLETNSSAPWSMKEKAWQIELKGTRFVGFKPSRVLQGKEDE